MVCNITIFQMKYVRGFLCMSFVLGKVILSFLVDSCDWSIYPYPPRLLHWHWGSRTCKIDPLPVKDIYIYYIYIGEQTTREYDDGRDVFKFLHYSDVIMGAMASQITSLTIVYSTVYSCADQRKHQRSASLAFVRGIHRSRWIPRTKGQ